MKQKNKDFAGKSGGNEDAAREAGRLKGRMIVTDEKFNKDLLDAAKAGDLSRIRGLISKGTGTDETTLNAIMKAIDAYGNSREAFTRKTFRDAVDMQRGFSDLMRF